MTDQSIVPEGFDLEAAKAAITKSRADEAQRCNECGYSALETRNGGIQHQRKEREWYCPNCQQVVSKDETYVGTFDDANG